LTPPNADALPPTYDPLGPSLARAHWPELERAVERCVGGRAGHVPFGDIEVRLTFRPARDSLVKLTPSAGLPPDVVACARRAIVAFARRIVTEDRRDVPRREWRTRESAADHVALLSLGKPRPLLDPNGGFVQRWRQLLETPRPRMPEARRALAASLPRDLRLAGDLCLEVTSTPRVWQGLEAWLSTATERVSLFWMADLDTQVWPEFTKSKPIVSLSKEPFPHDYYLPHGEPGVVIYRSAVEYNDEPYSPAPPDGGLYLPVNRVCLLPLRSREEGRIAAMINRRGACFAGRRPLDTLLAPRFAFPSDRRYAAVASGRAAGGPVCALDEQGHLSCCGITAFRSAGMEAFQAVSASKSDVCALSNGGAATCWPFNGGAARSLPGTFRAVSANEDGACAVEIGGGIYCEHPFARPPPGPYIAVDARAGCGLLASGIATCWAALSDDNGRGIGRDIVEFATNGGANIYGRKVCGRLRDGTIRCWGVGGEHAPPAAAKYARLVFNGYNECGIRQDGALDCWRPERPPPAGLPPVRDASLASPACAVTQDGKIVCWGDDMWNSR
jgi:hypothetical protein